MDITPTFNSVPAEIEVSVPAPVSDGGTQPIGGFMASPQALTNGNISLNGANEQILVGQATAPLAGAGIFIGRDTEGTYDFRAGDPAGNYIHWDASTATLTVVGSFTVTAGGTVGGFDVGADYLRDTTNTFGLASTISGATDVRFWAGDSFANRATAPARIYEDGTAVFKAVQVGGVNHQYTMNDQGIYTFGDGSDGAVTFNGSSTYSFATNSGGAANYVLTRDVFATSITVSNNVFLYPNGYRIFCQNAFTLQSGGQLIGDGNDASGTTGGAAGSAGYIPANIAGVNGGGGGAGFHAGGSGGAGSLGSDGNVGLSVSNSIGAAQGTVSGARGGDGGAASSFSGGNHGNGASGGTRTARNIAPVLPWNFQSFFDINADNSLSKYRGPAGNGSGGGGGGGSAASFQETGGAGGAGGGSGAAGGVIFLAARNLLINSGSNIFARGGKGGNGVNGGNGTSVGAGQAGGGGGGGGGAGGQGGVLFLIYNTITNLGTITLTGGAGGTAGTGGTAANAGAAGGIGTNGSSGAAGIQISINMAL
jgi:hypothetical protein